MLPRAIAHSIRFLGAVCGISMIATRELSLPFMILFVGFFVIGLFLDRFQSLSKTLHRLQPYIAFSFFLIAILDFFTLSRSFLLSVAHFLLALQGLRLLTLRTVRDCFGSLLLSSMMILSASTLSVDWSFFIFLSLFLPSAIWSLILLNLVTETQLNEAAKDTRLTAAEMKKVRAGLSEAGFSKEQSGAWTRTLPLLKRSTAVAFVVAMSCCLFVFTIFPRFNFRGFRGQFLQPVHKSGFTNRVDLEKGSKIFLDPAIVMRIEIDPKDRPLWPGSVRGSTLSLFDGTVWSRGGKDQMRPIYASRGSVNLMHERNRPTKQLRQNIYLESMDSPDLFAATLPVTIKSDRPYLMTGEDGSLVRGRSDTWRLRYEAVSLVAIDKKGVLPFGTLYQPEGSTWAYLKDLPAGFDSAPIKELALRLTQGLRSPMEKVKRLESYLRTEYSYTLDLSEMRGPDALKKFLFESKKGNCEYFASALCVMLRTLDIPCRMVTGFYAHEWNNRGGYYVVRMSDAHAWVECYVPGTGWIQLDPTPRPFGDAAPSSSWISRLSEAADFLNLKWNRYILSYDMDRQVQFVRTLNENSRDISVRFDRMGGVVKNIFGKLGALGGSTESNIQGRSSSLFVGVGLVAVFLMLAGFIFWIKKRAAQRSGVWYHDRLVRFLEKKGGPKPASKTLLEFIPNLKTSLGESFSDVNFLVREYYRLRFSPSGAQPAPQVYHTLKKLKI